jgi:NAD-dependent dihydropyrimidine dehydrogenase PreA subunit
VIELVSDSRCTGCGICVKVCPTNVFDGAVGEVPVIARQGDCQTCFMCEAYCPADALYVSPLADETEHVDEDALAEAGLLGSWRSRLGWHKGQTRLAAIDTTPFLHRVEPVRLDG